MALKLETLVKSLEQWAPPSLQESYDNSRLHFGDLQAEIKQVLISLDISSEIVDEAISRKANMIISHHPLIFGGLKSLTGKTDAERALIKAIQNNIAIYACHTNLDNVASGVNHEIGRRLGVASTHILSPKSSLLKKLVVFVPEADGQAVSEAMWNAGAGSIGNYDECSFRSTGTGTFRGNDQSNPSLGEPGIRREEKEYRLEVLVEQHLQNKVLRAMKEAHPYEEIAYELYPIENEHPLVGSGMYGDFEEPLPAMDLLNKIKRTFGGMLRYTQIPTQPVKRIAWCGGSGSFLLGAAKSVEADVFLSSDFKYHQFFEAENEILIADIGHFENEQFTIDLIAAYLRKNFPNFAVLLTENSTNPINYL